MRCSRRDRLPASADRISEVEPIVPPPRLAGWRGEPVRFALLLVKARRSSAEAQGRIMATPSADASAPARLVLIVAAVALAVRLPLLAAGPDVQLSLMADDACYYLEAARRCLETAAWPSMDGVHPTNGFHPLYFVLVLILQKLIGTETRIVTGVVFALNAALNVLALTVLVRSLRGKLGGTAGLVTVVALALSPGWLAHGLAGVENSLSSLLLLLAALRWIARFDPGAGIAPRAPGPQAGWWADGLLLGLAMLGRTDAVLFAALYLASAFILRARHERMQTIVRDLAICTGVAAVIVAPWAILNLWHFGTIAQDSAVALSTRFSRLHGAFGTVGWAGLFAKNIAFWLYRLGWTWGLLPLTFFLCGYALPLRRWRRLGGRSACAALAVLCAAALAIQVNDPWYIDAMRSSAVELTLGFASFAAGACAIREQQGFPRSTYYFLLGWTLLLALTMSGGIGSFQLWYTTAPALAAILLLTAPALAALVRPRPVMAVVLLCLLVAQSAIRVHRYLHRGTSAAGVSHHLIADGEVLRRRLQDAAATGAFRAGSFDSGQLSYRVHPFPVANLDGVMNHDAARAIAANTLAGHLRATGCTHLITSEDRLNYFRGVSPFEAQPDTAMSGRLGVTVFRPTTP